MSKPIDFYVFPMGAPSRAILFTAEILGIDFKFKLTNPIMKEQLKPEFVNVSVCQYIIVM